MQPKISVIMAVHNGEKYIEQSILSILNQTYTDWELCLFLDNCTDKTEDIVSRFDKITENEFKILKGNDKQGCPDSRMGAIRVCEGEYIAIQDADDISLPYRLEKQIRFMEKYPNIFCLGSWATKINEKGDVIDEMTYPPASNDDIVKMVIKNCRNPMIDPSVMFRKEDFLRLGGYSLDKTIYTVPDFELWMRAMVNNEIFANIQEQLVKYRVHKDGITSSKKRLMIKHHMKVWRKYVDILRSL